MFDTIRPRVQAQVRALYQLLYWAFLETNRETEPETKFETNLETKRETNPDFFLATFFAQREMPPTAAGEVSARALLATHRRGDTQWST